MVEPIANLPQVNMKEFAVHSAVWIQPVFGVTPEAFYAVYVIPAFGLSLLFPHDNMVSPHSQRRISMPVVRVVETPRPCGASHQPDHFTPLSSLHREHADLPVSLKYPEDDDLASCSPSSLSSPMPAKCSLIALDRSLEGFPTLLLHGKAGSDQSKEALHGWTGCLDSKPHPIDRDTQDEELDKPALADIRETDRFPHSGMSISPSATTTPQAAIRKLPCSTISTFRTSSHTWTIP